MNVSRVLSRLYLGSAPETVDDLKTLWDMGVGEIVNCRIEQDDAPLLAQISPDQFTFNYLWDGVPDWTPAAAEGKQPLPLKFFQLARAFVLPHFFSTDATFIHCTMGANRSVTLTYFLLRVLGIGETQAIVLLNDARALTLWWDFFDAPWRTDAENALKALGYV